MAAPSGPLIAVDDCADRGLMDEQPSPDRRPIGELFVEHGFVSEAQLRAALEYQRAIGGQFLGEILIERGLVSRLDLASILSEQWGAAKRQVRADSDGGAGPETDGVADLQSVAGELRDWLAGAAPVSELHAAIEAMRTELAQQQAAPVDIGGLHAELASLRSDIAARDAAVADVGAVHGAVVDLREARALDDERLDGLRAWLDERVTAFAAASRAERQTEFAAVESRLVDLLARRLDAVDEELAQIGRSAAAREEWLRHELQAAAESVSELVVRDRESEGEPSHVAFARTTSGYRLVELAGAVPPVGSELDVAALDGRFVVATIGRSPLPLDRRRCTYLEPVEAWTSGTRRAADNGSP
jgi:hypothetical protein